MVYLASAETQIDGSPAQMHNCGLTVGSNMADDWSLGYWRPAPAQLRILTGLSNTVGTTYPQIINAVSKATKGEVVLGALYWVAKSALDDALAAQRTVGLMINCAVTINTPYHTGTYTGLHEVKVSAHRFITVTRSDGSTYSQEQYQVMDPGKGAAYVTYQWWPAALLIAAGKAATSNGTLLLLLTRDLTGVTRKCVSAGPIRSAAQPGATVVGSVALGASYFVVTTARGGAWSPNAAGGTAYGWSMLGPGKFVAGLRLR